MVAAAAFEGKCSGERKGGERVGVSSLPDFSRSRSANEGRLTLEDISDPNSLLGPLSSLSLSPLLSRSSEVLVGNDGSGVRLHSVDPRVSNTVGELLLLSPEDGMREVGLDKRRRREMLRTTERSEREYNGKRSRTNLSVGSTVEGFSEDVLREEKEKESQRRFER